MRRLLAALTLCLSLLCPVALPVRAQQGTAAQQDTKNQTVYNYPHRQAVSSRRMPVFGGEQDPDQL